MCRVNSFKFKMSEEINRSVESDRGDLFDLLNYCDSTSSVEDMLAFAHAFDEKYAGQKESINMFKLVSLFHELEPG